jgi:asparagine synthase (glutamine-hydrolysing)
LEWGDDLVNRINGQFAFAIWDSSKQELFLARDHFGLKPLYYIKHGGGLIFASEIKAILAIIGPEYSVFDNAALPSYLQHRFVPNPLTMFSGVKKLRPGSFATWEAESGLTTSQFFNPVELENDGNNLSKERELVNEFLGHLTRSVKIRMVSDVPFGAFLSGGIDSASIVALMSEHSSLPVKTFSVGFEIKENSELHHARLVAEKFGCEHHELVIHAEDLPQHLQTLIRLRDAPVAEPSDIPIFLLSKFASEKVKMVLTGEGSDEILGGYEKYFLERYGTAYRRLLPAFLREKIIAGPINALPERFWRWKFAINTLNIKNDEERMALWFGGLRPTEISNLLLSSEFSEMKIANWSSNHSEIRNLMNFDQRYWLPDNLLERGDRMTMAASLEARMPFMDVEFARFAASLPDRMRIRSRKTKTILRLAMANRLPRSILKRPKIGFRVPVREWFRDELSDWVCDLLLSSDSKVSSMMDHAVLSDIVESHTKSEKNNEKIIWSIVTLELFLRELTGP